MFGRHRRVGVQGADALDDAPPVNLRAKAIAHLSRREHGRAELAKKLARLSSDRAAIDLVLDALAAENLLSERRAAESLVRQRAARQGTLRVAGELRARGIDGELAAEILQGMKQAEPERAQALWARKFGQPASDAAGRAKQMRFLQMRGFTSDVVRAVVPAVQPVMAEVE